MRARARLLTAWTAAATAAISACGSASSGPPGAGAGSPAASAPYHPCAPGGAGAGAGFAGLGAGSADWAAQHRAVGGSPLDYGPVQDDGRAHLTVHCGPGSRVLAVEVHHSPAVTLDAARREVDSLLPPDAGAVSDAVRSDKNCEREQYRSAWLAGIAPTGAPGGVIEVEYSSPPTTIGVYDPSQIGDVGIDTRARPAGSAAC